MATKKFLKELCDIGSINVLGTSYDLVFSVKKWVQDGTPGEVNLLLGKVFIDTSLSNNRISEIVLHEVLEIIYDRFTLRESHDGVDDAGKPIVHKNGHPELCAVEYGMSDFFRTNPKFGKLYLESLGHTIGNTYDETEFGYKTSKKEAGEVLKALTEKTKKESRTGCKKQKKGE